MVWFTKRGNTWEADFVEQIKYLAWDLLKNGLLIRHLSQKLWRTTSIGNEDLGVMSLKKKVEAKGMNESFQGNHWCVSST